MNLILDQCLAPFVRENFLDSPRDLLSLLEAVCVKLRFNISQLIECSVDMPRPSFNILLSFLSAANPMQPIAVGRFVITLRDIVTIMF